MYLKVDSKIFQQFPDLNLGILILKNINNLKKHTAVAQLINGATAQQKNKFAKEAFDDNIVIKTWRDAYKTFGANPSGTPCSIEALLKRILTDKEIPKINTLVDLYNYFSIKNLVPIGGEDMDQLCGDLKLTFASGEEAFRAIGSEKIESPDEGEVVYKDSGGVTCRRWNYRECDRTKFDQKTKNALLILEDLGILGPERMQKSVHELGALIQKYCGGEMEESLLTQKKSEINLGIAGRTGINDGEYQGTVYNLKGHTFSPQVKSRKKTKLEGDTLLRIKLENLVIEATKNAYPQKDICEATIEYPADISNGDYSCNIAMGLAKEVGLNPKEVAQEIIAKFQKPQYVEKIEIAGPGFINFYLERKWIEQEIGKTLEEKDDYGRLNIGEGRKIIVEYSQPNIAKPLGVHHLLSTVVGQSLYDIYKYLGFDCISINHIGDWGTQFGKLTYAYKQWGEHDIIEKNPIAELLKLYVRFHDEAQDDKSLEDRARAEFKKLEDSDPQNTKLWEWFCKISMEEVQRTYDFLGGIHFDHTQGESFYNNKMNAIIEDGQKKGVIVEGENGSLIVKFKEDKYPPFLVKKSDGATLYSTRDLAAIEYRQMTWHPEKILYVVDVAQSLHFQQLIETADMLGTRESELVHVVFGRMQFKDKRMSTRKGDIILLDEVLEEAVKKARKIVEEKSNELPEKEKSKAARTIGVGAVKYSILSQNRATNITFDWEKILSLEGNSAPYLQYTYARAGSILRKASEPISRRSGASQVTLFDALEDNSSSEIQKPQISKEPVKAEVKEMDILREIVKFSEHVALAAAEYKPNILANYLYALAQKFNTFYNSVPVLSAGSERENRLKIVTSVSIVLKNGLRLLGIEVMERM